MGSKYKGLSTGLGLFILAVGFSSLGLLTFVNRPPKNGVAGFFSEDTYSIIGSSFSILVGAAFLVATILFAGTLLRARSTLTTGCDHCDR
jgi:hypothetical protein